MSKMRAEGECLVWTGPRDSDGYGLTRLFGQRRAHRVAWEIANGPIPAGLWVLHRCDNPPCVNAAHLFLGTPADNMHDRAAKGRYASGDQHHFHTRPETVTRGQAHYLAKLTAAQVEEIRSSFVDRYGEQTRLARKYGVTSGTIHLIVRNKNWKPIPEAHNGL